MQAFYMIYSQRQLAHKFMSKVYFNTISLCVNDDDNCLINIIDPYPPNRPLSGGAMFRVDS